MKNTFRSWPAIIMAGFLLILSGCGGSTKTKTQSDSSSECLTGDTTLFPNSDLLASAEDLSDSMNSKASSPIIIDTRSADDYAAGHIPGAINMDWQDFVDGDTAPERAILKSVDDLETLLGGMGLTRTAEIVIYDDTLASWGSAGRIFWMLESLGCINVRILNGGWDKWAADGRDTETSTNTLEASTFTANTGLFPDASMDRDEILTRLDDDDFVLVDTRTDEEFIGWTLYGEDRGGHITGAVHLPYEDYFNEDYSILSYEELSALLESKGITMDKDVAAYCTAGIRSGFFYFLGRLMGYSVANYDGSIWEWAASDSSTYPMEKLANYQALVYPAWVDSLIKGNSPETYPGNGYVILFTSYDARYSENRTDYVGTPYETGHIPGAIFMDTYSLENGPTSEYGEGYASAQDGNAKSVSELQTYYSAMGISKDTTVIVYADDDISMMTAGRTAWSLLLAGVEDVRILNGSYDAWVAYGGEQETTVNTLDAVSFGESDGGTQYLATMDDLDEVIDGTNGDAIIVDDRDWTEFVGSSNSYYPYFSEYGRIPTAQWIGDWGEIVSSDSQSMKIYTEVEDDWTAAGFTTDKTMYFYCGTGWRSGLYTFYAYVMGWPAANYDGGWFEWSTDDSEKDRVTGHSDKLITADTLKTLIDDGNDGNACVIIETGWGPVGDTYNNGHIPGAIWVNTDEIEYDCFHTREYMEAKDKCISDTTDESYSTNPCTDYDLTCYERTTTVAEDQAKGLGETDELERNWWNIYPDQYLIPAIEYMGVDKNTTVVVYGNASAAARVVWTLMYAGVEDVRFLDGGKSAWTSAGYTLETQANERGTVSCFDPDNTDRTTAIHPEYLVEIPYVRDVVNEDDTDDGLMVDIRSYEEYTGAIIGYSYMFVDGRIPGAVWGTEDFQNEDGTLIDPSEMYSFWRGKGITDDKHLNFYCGTAWRSSLAWFYTYLMGFDNISNFDSSWFEWSMGEGSEYNYEQTGTTGDILNPIEDDEPDLP